MTDYEAGVLVGLLVGEGHFGGDGKQPQITLRMHARHEALFRRLLEWVPGSKLYGPYHHANRHYVQWMARGAALRALVARLEGLPIAIRDLDPHVAERYDRMITTYRARLAAPDADARATQDT